MMIEEIAHWGTLFLLLATFLTFFYLAVRVKMSTGRVRHSLKFQMALVVFLWLLAETAPLIIPALTHESDLGMVIHTIVMSLFTIFIVVKMKHLVRVGK